LHILDVFCCYYDSAAALINDRKIILRTPEDAFHCFVGTEAEILMISNVVLHKESQGPPLKKDSNKLLNLINL
jgi:predicted NodU family carbamoyl transferase